MEGKKGDDSLHTFGHGWCVGRKHSGEFPSYSDYVKEVTAHKVELRKSVKKQQQLLTLPDSPDDNKQTQATTASGGDASGKVKSQPPQGGGGEKRPRAYVTQIRVTQDH